MSFANYSLATVDGPGRRIAFQTMPGYQPARWLDPASSIQMHLDLLRRRPGRDRGPGAGSRCDQGRLPAQRRPLPGLHRPGWARVLPVDIGRNPADADRSAILKSRLGRQNPWPLSTLDRISCWKLRAMVGS